MVVVGCDRCTTPTLTRTLNTILMHHIRDCLPDIKSRINSMMIDVQRELDALGRSPATPHACLRIMISVQPPPRFRAMRPDLPQSVSSHHTSFAL